MCWRSICISQPSLCSYFKILESSNFVCHACCRAIICLPSFISHRPAICYLYTVLIVHTLHPYSHYCFLCMGISDSANQLIEARNKREKQLQLSLGLGKTCFSVIKGEVSADGDSKRSSTVDDLNCHTQPSQVLALTLRCQMWLQVAYGV